MMARRQEVFQSKVLQKLYPAASQREEEPSPPPHIVEPLAQKLCPKRNTSRGDVGAAGSAAHLGRRVYTALPPPADYQTPLPVSPPPHPEEINRSGDPAESSEEPDPDGEEEEEEEEEGHGRRRRKRRRKPAAAQGEQHLESAAASEPSATRDEPSATQDGEGLSRNKRRKLKKKRHKEKLLASGLAPRAAALEFTYQKEGGDSGVSSAKARGMAAAYPCHTQLTPLGGEEEEEERRAAEVTDFLRTTMETYMADGRPSLVPGAAEELLSRMSSGRAPPAVLGQLHHLKALVQQKEPDRLAQALEELNASSSLSPEETSAVVGLFQYWITDILPMRTHRETGPATKQTEDPPHQPD